jgi:MFS family permease
VPATRQLTAVAGITGRMSGPRAPAPTYQPNTGQTAPHKIRTETDMTTTTLPAASAQAAAAGYTGRRRQITVVVVALTFVMDLMDATILTIALPTIQRHMHASLATVNWMATAYPLAFTVLLITGGQLGDVLGYRRLFSAGVIAFGLASVLVGTAGSPDMLITARILQGAAAALMVPQVLSIVQLLYKAEERTQVAGMLGGLTMLATTAAPLITAGLIGADLFGLSWRPIFLLNVPVCAAALVLAARCLPADGSARRQRVDLPGTALITAAVLLLVFPLIQGRALGWPAWCYAMLAAAVPVFAAFGWRQRRIAAAGGSPLISPALFGHRSFTAGLGISLLVTATVGCFGLTFTLLLQTGHHYSALHAVLTALFLTGGMTIVAGALAKRAIPALGRWSLSAGAVIMAAGIWAVAALAGQPHLSTWQLAPALVVLGAGMGLVFVPMLPYILAAVPPSDAGAASGVANAVQQAGGTLGIAILGAVFFGQLATTGNYRHAFTIAAALQIALLAGCAALSLALPRRIAADAYQPTL